MTTGLIMERVVMPDVRMAVISLSSFNLENKRTVPESIAMGTVNMNKEGKIYKNRRIVLIRPAPLFRRRSARSNN